MHYKIKIKKHSRKWIVLFFITIYLAVYVFSLLTSRELINKPFPGFLVFKNNLVNLISLPDWEGPRRGIKGRDIVVEVNGHNVVDSIELKKFVRRQKPGTMLTYTIDRHGERLKIDVPVSMFTLRDFLICYMTWTLFGLLFFATAMVVFYLKSNSADGRSFFLVGVLAGFLTASLWECCSSNVNNLPVYLFPMVGPGIILIGVNFPERLQWRKYVLYPTLFMTLAITVLYRYSFSDAFFFRQIDTLFLIHTLLAAAIGVALMSYSFITSMNPAVKQKGKLVILSFLIAVLSSSLSIYYIFVLKRINFFWIVVPLLFIPLSMAFSIVKHNLFDIDVVLRRTVSYLLASGVVLTIFFVFIGLFSLRIQDLTGQSSQVAAVIATLLLVAVFRPLLRWTEEYINRIFFREKYRYKRTIRKASHMLASIIELDQLLYQMLNTVLEAMSVERGLILLKEKSPERFSLAAIEDYSGGFNPAGEKDYRSMELDILDINNPICEYLEKTHNTLQINEIEESEKFAEKKNDFLSFMYGLEAMLLIPIVFEYRLIGILGLGHKKSGTLYSKEDIDILQTLMMQTAVSIENAKKVEDLKKMVELETSYKELQRINEMKDNFISMVSHDLRTPMTSIKGYASILYDSLNRFDEETVKGYLGIIIDESDRLTRLIKDILDLQKFEAGRMILDFNDIDINVLVREVVNIFKPDAEKKNLKIGTILPEDNVFIKANRDRMYQVLNNLISNAIKFTPEGGSIKAEVEVLSVNGESATKVSIKDTGPGIEENVQTELFEKFHQAESLIREKNEGSGLGLALVKEIIEHHGGSVGVESELGQGTTFYFVLQKSNLDLTERG